MGVTALNELAVQAETLDRMEGQLEHIQAMLDKGDRYISSMESVTGAFRNALSKEKKTPNFNNQFDRTLTIQRQAKLLDIDILMKRHDNTYEKAFIEIEEEEYFGCKTADTRRQIPNCRWKYFDVSQIIVKSSPLQMEIRFSTKIPPFRLLSSYLQVITNELMLHAESKSQIQIIFEPLAKKFQFGSFRISNELSTQIGKGRISTAGNAAGGGFRRGTNTQKASAILSDNCNQELKQEFDEQEANLEEISNVLGDMVPIATTMSQEVDRQNEQLDRISHKTQKVDAHVHNSLYRAKQIT